jgi:hypothetical protein
MDLGKNYGSFMKHIEANTPSTIKENIAQEEFEKRRQK